MLHRSVFSAIVALTLVVINVPQMAAAEGLDSSPWKYWLGGGAHFFEADDAVEAGQLYEARVSYDYSERITSEFGLGGSPFFEGNDFNAPDPKEATFNGRNSPGESWMGKANIGMLYHLNGDADKTWDPYLSLIGGVSYFGKRREGNNVAPFGGPGLGVSYWFSDSFALRADYSMLVTEDGDAELNHEGLLFAFYRFGGDDNLRGGGDGADSSELGGRSSSPLKTIYFDFDKSALTAESQQRLRDNAAWMKEHPGTEISLEGHCDERGTNEYNMALGARRAQAALDFLRALGVPATQTSTVSYGEEFPADPGHSEEAWSKNRRVESLIKK